MPPPLVAAVALVGDSVRDSAFAVSVEMMIPVADSFHASGRWNPVVPMAIDCFDSEDCLTRADLMVVNFPENVVVLEPMVSPLASRGLVAYHMETSYPFVVILIALEDQRRVAH